MKITTIILLLFVSSIAYSQSNYTISIEGNYGFRAYNRPLVMNGTYEGLTLGYYHQINRSNNTWNVQLWNTDLTRLQHLRDTLSRNSLGAEYGLGGGVSLNLYKWRSVSLSVLPQLGMTFIPKGVLNSDYRDAVINNRFNPIFRTQLILNYNMFYITGGFSHQFSSLSHANMYFEKTWIGIGIRQK